MVLSKLDILEKHQYKLIEFKKRFVELLHESKILSSTGCRGSNANLTKNQFDKS